MGSLITTELSRLDSLASDSYAVQLRSDSAWLPVKYVLSSPRQTASPVPPDSAALKALGQAEVLAAFALEDQDAFQSLKSKLITGLQAAVKGLNSAGVRGTEEMEETVSRTQLAMRRYRWLLQKTAAVLRVEKPPTLLGCEKVNIDSLAGVCTLCDLLQKAPNSPDLRSALIEKAIEVFSHLGPMSLLSADSQVQSSLLIAAQMMGQWEAAESMAKAMVALMALALAQGSLGDALTAGLRLMQLQQLPAPLHATLHKIVQPLSELPEKLSAGRVEFTWNTTKKGPDIAISNQGKTITRTDSAGWGCNLSAQSISEGSCYIEFKIDKNSSSCLLLGIAGPRFDNYSSKSSCNGAMTLQADGDLYLDGNGLGKSFRYSEKDRLGMLINMEEHTLAYFLNGKMQENKPYSFPYKQVYLCACFGGSEQFVTIDTESEVPIAAQEYLTRTVPTKKWQARAEERLPAEARTCSVRQIVTFLLSELSRYAAICYHPNGVNSYTGTESASGRILRTGKSLLLDLRTITFERLMDICEFAAEIGDKLCLSYAVKLLRVQLFACTYALPRAALETALSPRIRGFLTAQMQRSSEKNCKELMLALGHGLNYLYPQPCDKLELLNFAINSNDEVLTILNSVTFWEGMLDMSRPEDFISASTALSTVFTTAIGPRPVLLDSLAIAQKVLLSKAEENAFMGGWSSVIADYATVLLEKSADLLNVISPLPELETLTKGRCTLLDQLLPTFLYSLSLCRLPVRVQEPILTYMPSLIQSLATIPVCSTASRPAFSLESAHPCVPTDPDRTIYTLDATSYSFSFDRSSDIGSGVFQIWLGAKTKKLKEWTGPHFPREAVHFPTPERLKLVVLPGKAEVWGWKVTVTPHGQWREPGDWIEEVRKGTYSFLTYAARTLIEGVSIPASSMLDSPLFQCGISDKCEMAVRGQRSMLERCLPLLAQVSYRVRKGDSEMPALRRSASQLLTKRPSPLHSVSTYLSAFTATSPLVYSENRDIDRFIRAGELRWKELKQEAGAVGPATTIGGAELDQVERGLFCVFFSLFGLSDRFNELLEGIESAGDQLSFLIRQTTQFRRWAQSYKQDHNLSYSALTALLLPRLSVLLRLPFDSLRVSLELEIIRCLTVKSYSKASSGSLELTRQKSVEQSASNVHRVRSLLSVTMPERSGVDERLQKDWKRASSLVYEFLSSEEKLETCMEVREQRRNRAVERCLGLNILVDVMKSRNRSRDMERLACYSLSNALVAPSGERLSHMSGLAGIDPVLSQCVQTSFFTLYQSLAACFDLNRFKSLDCTSEEVTESSLALLHALACPLGPNEMETLGKIRLRGLLECLMAWAKGQGFTEFGRKSFDISKCITELEVIRRKGVKMDLRLIVLSKERALKKTYGGDDATPIQQLVLAAQAAKEMGEPRAKIDNRSLYYRRAPPEPGQSYLTDITLESSKPVTFKLHTTSYEHLLRPNETQEEADARADRKKRLRQASWVLLRLLIYSICGTSKTDPGLVRMTLNLISGDLEWGPSQSPLLSTDLTNKSKLHLRKVSLGSFWLESTLSQAQRPTNPVAEWIKQVTSLCGVLGGREFSPALQEFASGYIKSITRFIAAIDPTYSGVVRLTDVDSLYREEMAGYVNTEGYVDFFMFAKGELSTQLAANGLELPSFPLLQRLPSSFPEAKAMLGHGTIYGILSQIDTAVKLHGYPVLDRLLGWFKAATEPGRVPQSINTDSVPLEFLNSNKELDLLTALTAIKRDPEKHADYWSALQSVPIAWEDLPDSCEDLCRNSVSLSALSASLLWTLYQCMRSANFEMALSESNLMREIMSYAFASGSEVLSVLGFRLMRRLFASSCSVPVVQRLWNQTSKVNIDYLTDTGDMVKTLVALAGLQVGLHIRPKQPNKALSLSTISQLSGEALECLQAMYVSPQWRSQVVTKLSQILHSLCLLPPAALADSSALELGALAFLSRGQNSYFDLREWACIDLSDSQIQTAIVLSLHPGKAHITLYNPDANAIVQEPILHVDRTISPFPLNYFMDMSAETAQEMANLLVTIVRKAGEIDYSEAETVEIAIAMRLVWGQAAALAIRGLNVLIEDRSTLDFSILTPIMQYLATVKPVPGVTFDQSSLQATKERLYLRYYNQKEALYPADEPMTSDKQNQIIAAMSEDQQVLVTSALSMGITFENILSAREHGFQSTAEVSAWVEAQSHQSPVSTSLIYRLDAQAMVKQKDQSGTTALHRHENGAVKLTAMEKSAERKAVEVDIAELVMGKLTAACEGICILMAVSGGEFGVGMGNMEINVKEGRDGCSLMHQGEMIYAFPELLPTYELGIYVNYHGSVCLWWPGLPSPVPLPTRYPDIFTGLSLAPLVLSLPANTTASVTLKGLAVHPYDYTPDCAFWQERMEEDGQLLRVEEYHGCTTALRLCFAGVPAAIASETALQFPAFKSALGAILSAGTPFPGPIPKDTAFPIEDIKLLNPGNSLPEGYELVPGLDPSPLRCPLLFKRGTQAGGQGILSILYGEGPGSKVGDMSLAPEEYASIPLTLVRGNGGEEIQDLKFVKGKEGEITLEAGYFLLKSAKKAVNFALKTETEAVFLAIRSSRLLLSAPVVNLAGIPKEKAGYGLADDEQIRPKRKPIAEQAKDYLKIAKNTLNGLFYSCMLQEQAEIHVLASQFLLETVHKHPTILPSLCASDPHLLSLLLSFAKGQRKHLEPGLKLALAELESLPLSLLIDSVDSFSSWRYGRGFSEETVESVHPYENNMRLDQTITIPRAKRLVITFDLRTKTESGCDYVRFYGMPGHQKLLYERAGSDFPTLEVEGDTVFFYFYSDGSGVDWGYKFTVTGIREENGGIDSGTGIWAVQQILKGKPKECELFLKQEFMYSLLVFLHSAIPANERRSSLRLLCQLLAQAQPIPPHCNEILAVLARDVTQLYESEQSTSLSDLTRSLLSLFLSRALDTAVNLTEPWFLSLVKAAQMIQGFVTNSPTLDSLLFKQFLAGKTMTFAEVHESPHPYFPMPAVLCVNIAGAKSLELTLDPSTSFSPAHAFYLSHDPEGLQPVTTAAAASALPEWLARPCGPNITLSNNNQTVTRTDSSGWGSVIWGTSYASGQHIFTYFIDNGGSSDNLLIGLTGESAEEISLSTYLGSLPKAWAWKRDGLVKSPNEEKTIPEAAYNTGDVVSLSLDFPSASLTLIKNGQEVYRFEGLSECFTPIVCFGGSNQFVTAVGVESTGSRQPLYARHMSVPGDIVYCHFPVNTGYPRLRGNTWAMLSGLGNLITVSEEQRKIARLGEPDTWVTMPFAASFTRGRHYGEIEMVDLADDNLYFGVVESGSEWFLVPDTYFSYSGELMVQGTSQACPSSFSQGDHVGILLDLEQASLSIFVNGVLLQTSDFIPEGKEYSFAVSAKAVGQQIRIITDPQLPRELDLYSPAGPVEGWGFQLTAVPMFEEAELVRLLPRLPPAAQTAWESLRNRFRGLVLRHCETIVQLIDSRFAALRKSPLEEELIDLTLTPIEAILYSPLTELSPEDLNFAYKCLKDLNSVVISALPMIIPERKGQEERSDIEILFSRCKSLLFFAPKHRFFSELLAQTHSNQRESLTIDRTKAMMWRRDGKIDHKLTVSVFSQLCNLTNSKPADVFRSSERIYRVTFAGEGAADAGGPYNETLSTICDELQSQLVPLLTPTPNHRNSLGELRDAWLPDPNFSSEAHMSHFKFLGKMLGVAIRTQNNLNLSFPPLFWKRVLQEQVTIGDLKGVDEATFHMLEILRDPAKAGLGAEEFAEAFAGVVFAYADSSGKSQELVPNGSEKPVTLANAREYADLVEHFRLSESESIYEEIRNGISVVVPSHLLNLFSWRQLEALVCGAPDIDVDLLARKTSYGSWNQDDQQVKWLWDALRSFTPQERCLFLRFVWGRSRLPAQGDFRNFSLQKLGREPADNYLPVAHTCGFGLDLPLYSSAEVLKSKVLYAITQCQGIDLDGLAGGGWVDEE